MKRFVLSLVAAGSVAASPLLMAGPAFASGGSHEGEGNKTSTSTACSNGGLVQVQLVCVGTISVPIVLNVLSGDNFFSNQSIAANKGVAKS
jgi:hypothetical protein